MGDNKLIFAGFDPMNRLNRAKSKKKFYADRTYQPVYVDLLPPCNEACPAGENVQLWMTLAQAGRWREAWEVIIKNNPMPAIHGRVCYHPCELSCNRKFIDVSVNIHAVERFLGDMALTEKWSVPATAMLPLNGKKILIIGSGPAGLAAAYHLRLLGYEPTIYEALPKAGGMMRIGIPRYRLPQEILDGEIKRIEDMGIKIICNHKVTDVLAEKEQGGFAAGFMAVGAHQGWRSELKLNNPQCLIEEAIAFLQSVEFGEVPKLGERLIVYGGGNTAIDVARTARRLGVREIFVVYHRDRQRMVAFDFEVEEALEEGIKFVFLRSLQAINGKMAQFDIVELDAAGKKKITGQIEELPVDTLIFALGQTPATDFLRTVSGMQINDNATVNIDATMMTGCAGIFAGGDMLPSERSVTIATGHGKKAAHYIDAYLRSARYEQPPKHKRVTYDMMNVWFEDESAKTKQKLVAPAERSSSFAEVVKDLPLSESAYEAQRCLSCGNCFECDGCYAACPERAITKLGRDKRYRIDYDLCTGCGVCYEQCPCAAIEMVLRK
jgi:formate dehydrogenase (NADP+) beta subunit